MHSSVSTQVPANRETSELTEADRRVKFGWEGEANKATNMDRVSAKKTKKIKTFSVQLCWLSAINCTSACFHKATGKDFVSPLPYNTFKG